MGECLYLLSFFFPESTVKPEFVRGIFLPKPCVHLKGCHYSLKDIGCFAVTIGLDNSLQSLQWQLRSLLSYTRLKVRSKCLVCKPEHDLLDIYSQLLKSLKPVNDVKQDRNRSSYLFFLNELEFIKEIGTKTLKRKILFYHTHYESTKPLNFSWKNHLKKSCLCVCLCVFL